MTALRRALLRIAALGLIAGLPAAHAATEARTLPPFQAVALAGSIDLEVSQGETQAVQVQADDKLLPDVETVVANGRHGATLEVRLKPGLRWFSGRVRVSLVLPRLQALSSNGSGDIRLAAFETPALHIALAGSGNVRLAGLRTEALEIAIAGAGDVSGSGRATRLKVGISGSGDVRLAELAADEVAVKIAGAGDVAVNAQQRLDVRISGSGDVSYTGAAVVSQSIAGSGRITRR
ncbi:conserved exported hypothetical protein [Rubrivivax sp. A210]|uniref:head GIN domain-containing protein n=1 Tax=Rubrivivax sp. A210 TaxID=2772301 RepID=UPI00191864E2|nr:head GIN domain-containing protein [Rubrivivax sp. A210]CAD5375247.1 conserved exported hypothetical protein [Rubrivivax sp. A210]